MNDVTRVLLVDDDEDECFIIRSILTKIPNQKYDLAWEKTYEDGIKILGNGGYDVCLLDYRLGTRTGLEFLDEAMNMDCPTPIIMLTGHGDYNVDLQAMKKGAADFIVKDEITPSLLERSIRYSVERGRYESALVEARNTLEETVKKRTIELESANRELQKEARQKEKLISELREAISEVKTLSGLIPICSSCKKIRDDTGYWNQIESYIQKHSNANFSHGLCPDCVEKLYPGLKNR